MVQRPLWFLQLIPTQRQSVDWPALGRISARVALTGIG